MKKMLICLMAVMVIAVGLVGCGEKKAEKKSVSTDGSTSMEKLIGALGETYKKENDGVTFTYNPTGSGSGITAVAEDRCDIGLSSRYLKPEEKKKGLEETVVGLDGISIIVNSKNAVDNLSIEQISKIYKGEITNWKEVGGKDMNIVVIGREAGSGTRDGFESITKTESACKYRQEQTSTGDVITTVAGTPGAIGYASMSVVSKNVKALKVGGVAPSEKTVKDGSYVIQRPFMMITKKDKKLSEEAQKFMDYALSKKTDELKIKAGVVPAK